MSWFIILLCGLVGIVLSTEQRASFEFARDIENTVLLRLDYGTYRGHYNETNEVYVFKNIRYAAPPLGVLRWAKPVPPPRTYEVQGGRLEDAIACSQPIRSDVRTAYLNTTVGPGQEDCLFLDLTIPRRVFDRPWEKLPVLVWVHGGYYTVGSKDERGFHMLSKATDGHMISVAPNYRLGVYGFLAGNTIEKYAVPNVGLWDQRAAFEWVQKYIPDIGGDKTQVTAMGISAGAGSILHHLVAEGGTKDPLFRRAIVQSAGYDTKMDRTGEVQRKFEQVEEISGCRHQGLLCLRAIPEEDFRRVSEHLSRDFKPGNSGWDPIPDGKFIVKTPSLEVAAGRYWKQMDSIISGYALNEGPWFTDKSINTSEKFDKYVRDAYGDRPGMAALVDRAKYLYPPAEAPGSPFHTTLDRLGLYVGDAGFNCHHRLLVEAYPDKTWTYQGALFGGGHYVDQFLSFFDAESPSSATYSASTKVGLKAFMSYLTSEIITGNPNTMRNEATIEWPLTTGLTDRTLSGILNWSDPVGPKGFSIIPSPRLSRERCEFWNDVWTQMDKSFM